VCLKGSIIYTLLQEEEVVGLFLNVGGIAQGGKSLVREIIVILSRSLEE